MCGIKDFPLLHKQGIIDGIAAGNWPESAYVIWLNNVELKLGQIAMLWVAPQNRGQDIGYKLLCGALNKMKKQRLEKLFYVASVDNYRVLPLLSKLGFKLDRVIINKLM